MAKIRSGKANRRQFVYRPNRGLVPFGYKYLGPFNSLNKGKPTNPTDEAALKHDNEYTHFKGNPYTTYNSADEQFIEATKDAKDWGGKLANWAFNKKRKLAQAGWIGTSMDTTPNTLKSFLNTPDTVQAKRKRLERNSKGNTAKKLDFSEAEEKAAIMSDGGGSGNDMGTKETPIDDVGHVTRGPQEYCFASLPYLRNWSVVSGSNTDNYLDIACFRMTSAYDARVGQTTADANVGAGTLNTVSTSSDAADASAQTARWFNFYAGIYNYYHVVSAQWHFTFENLGMAPLWVHVMYGNENQPPALADNHDIRLWPGVKSHYVGPQGAAILSTGTTERLDKITGDNEPDQAMASADAANYESGNHITSRGASPILTIGGKYEPGQYKRQIHLDSAVENWTAVTTNPALSERLYIYIKPQAFGQELNSANDYNQHINYNAEFFIEYLTEFKELASAVRWPVQKQPISVTLNNTTTAQ